MELNGILRIEGVYVFATMLDVEHCMEINYQYNGRYQCERRQNLITIYEILLLGYCFDKFISEKETIHFDWVVLGKMKTFKLNSICSLNAIKLNEINGEPSEFSVVRGERAQT